MRAAIVAALLIARTASADPSDADLVVAGAGMALPTYVLGVTWHEGSHALAAELLGAHVDELHVFPPGIDPRAHVFRFGWTYVHGLETERDLEIFLLAPKVTDLVLIGGFAALVFTSAWPGNRYGALALTVGATGAWVDFAKDVLSTSPHDDVIRVLDLWCVNKLAARIGYGLIDAGLALIVARGYERVFERDPGPIIPLFRTAF